MTEVAVATEQDRQRGVMPTLAVTGWGDFGSRSGPEMSQRSAPARRS